MPFFSVIIPLYNKESYIENTIKSVLNQTFQDFEIIIIDDGSTDNSNQIAAQFQDYRIKIIKQENKGVAFARNSGIFNAKSEHIALLDADDLWYNNHLAELKKQITMFPEAGVYCNNYEIYFSENKFRKSKFNFNYNDDCLIIKDFFKANMIDSIPWTSATGFSKKKFMNIGKFNPNYKTSEDLDLWIRFALKYDISFNPKTTMSYKAYIKDSLTKNEFNDLRYNFLNSYIEVEKSNPSLKKYLDKKRYGFAIRCKINNNKKFYLKTIKGIDFKNLSYKRRILLLLPAIILKSLNQFNLIILNPLGVII
jgi:glycosyltransferase involved in cell wall biosynthesis